LKKCYNLVGIVYEKVDACLVWGLAVYNGGEEIKLPIRVLKRTKDLTIKTYH